MAAAYAAMFAHTGALLIIPLFVRWIVDHGIIAGDRSALIGSVIALAGLAAARAVFGFLQGRLAEMAAQRLAYDLRNELFLRLGVVEISFIEKMETGQVLQRAIQDVERLRFVVSKALLRVLDAAVLFAGTLAFMLAMNPVLGAASLIPVPFLAVQAFIFAKQQRPLASRLQQQLGVMTSALEQNLQGAAAGQGVRAGAAGDRAVSAAGRSLVRDLGAQHEAEGHTHAALVADRQPGPGGGRGHRRPDGRARREP